MPFDYQLLEFLLCGSEKLVSDCFSEAKLKSVATVIAKYRKLSRNIANYPKISQNIAPKEGKRMLEKKSASKMSLKAEELLFRNFTVGNTKLRLPDFEGNHKS
jgi:hypothetical protein